MQKNAVYQCMCYQTFMKNKRSLKKTHLILPLGINMFGFVPLFATP